MRMYAACKPNLEPGRKRVALLDLNETNRDSTKSTLKCQVKDKVNLKVLIIPKYTPKIHSCAKRGPEQRAFSNPNSISE